MRRAILSAAVLCACLGVSHAAKASPPQNEAPASFNRQESARLRSEGIDLALANPAAQSELRAALDSGDPALIAAAKDKLRRSKGVYERWFNDPASALALKNDPSPQGRRAFRDQWNLLDETLPPQTMAALVHLKLQRLGVSAPMEPENPFGLSADLSLIPFREEPGSISPTEEASLADEIWRDFCRRFGCSSTG